MVVESDDSGAESSPDNGKTDVGATLPHTGLGECNREHYHMLLLAFMSSNMCVKVIIYYPAVKFLYTIKVCSAGLKKWSWILQPWIDD